MIVVGGADEVVDVGCVVVVDVVDVVVFATGWVVVVLVVVGVLVLVDVLAIVVGDDVPTGARTVTVVATVADE